MEMQRDDTVLTINDILNAPIVFEDDCTSCASEIKKEDDEIALIEAECKELRRKYHDMLVENIKKDVEIDELEVKIREKSSYAEFTNKFSDESMKTLRSFETAEANDSKYVLAAVRGLYEDRLEVLKERNLSGRSKNRKKYPVTPVKLKILQDIFTERIKNTTGFAERRQNLNALIKSAIETINKIQH